jgi:hypothetical protein
VAFRVADPGVIKSSTYFNHNFDHNFDPNFIQIAVRTASFIPTDEVEVLAFSPNSITNNSVKIPQSPNSIIETTNLAHG